MGISELFDALEQNPTDLQALDAVQNACLADSNQADLERAYAMALTRIEDPKALEQTLRRIEMKIRTVKENPELQSWMQFYVGFQYWTRLEMTDKAEMLFRKVGVEGPYADILTDFYKTFYANKENWRRLEELMMRSVEDGDQDQVAEVKRYLARLAEEKGKKDKAISFWAGVRQNTDADEEAEGRLRELYVEVKKWHSLIELLNDKLGRVPLEEVDEKIAIHLEMVEIFRDHVRSDTKVNSAYQAILELQPDNRMALDALVAQFTNMKRWPDLVRTLQQKVQYTEETADLIALHREIATIMQEKFSNSSEAIKSYQAILELDPTDTDALATLKDVYEKRRDYEHYIEISLKEVELLEDADERHRATVELAKLASERIRKPAFAIDLWARVLDHDGENIDALGNLEMLYEREKAYPKLVDVMEKKLAVTEADSDKITILQKLGLIYGTRLDDGERTIETWKRVLELDPNDRKAQADLRKRFLKAHDWDELEWFFRSFATVEEFVRTLESQVKEIEEDGDKIGLLFKAARIWREEIDNTGRAVKSLEKILAIAPEHHETAEMLHPIYRELGQWDKLPGVCEIKLNHTEDPAAREAIFLELAEVHETHLKDPSQAFYNWVEAFKANWRDDLIHGELERLAAASENWETYVFVLEETLENVDDRDYRIRYLTRLAQVQESELGSDGMALSWYLKVLEEDAENTVALDAIEGLYRKMSRWSDLIDVLQRKLALTYDEEAKKELMFQLGSAWREFMGNNEEAVAVYRNMLEQFPDEARIHEELSTIFLEEEDYGNLREVLERRLELLQRQEADAKEIAGVLCDLGMLTYGTAEDGAELEPVIACYERALETDEDSVRAVSLLEELLASEADRPRISTILEPVYTRREQWDKLADIHEIQLQEMAAQEGTEDDRIDLLVKLGELYRDKLGDAALAFRSYSRVFRLDPLDPDVRPNLEALAELLDSWFELVALYRDEVDRIDNDEVRLDVLLTVARLYHAQLRDPESAQAFYNLVLEIDSAHAASLDALEELYLELERWEELLGIYQRKCDLAEDDASKIRYLFEISNLWRDQLENPDEAIAAAMRVLDIDATNIDALQHLDALYESNERWESLAETLNRLIELSEATEDIVGFKVRLAEVEEYKLGDVEAAIRTYASIIEIAPDNEPALLALERLFQDPDWSRLIAPILEPHYERQGDWEQLIKVYEVLEANAEDDIELRVALHFKISALYEERGADPASAFLHYAEAYRLVPEREDTLENLLRLAEGLANHEDLVSLIEERVEDVGDPDRKRELHRVAAELSRDRVGDMEGAKKHFRSVLDLFPEDLPALDALIELHRGQEEWDDLVEALLQKAPLVGDLEDRKQLYGEAGELSDARLDDPEKAIEIFETLRNLDRDDPRALDPLEGLYARVENWSELVAVFSEKIERSDDLDEKKLYAAEKARVQDEKQESLDDAVDTYRVVLDWDPADLNALQMLDQLYTRKEDWYSLLEILQKEMDLVDEGERLALQFRVGQLYETELEDIVQAIGAHRTILEARPDHGEALEALTAIVQERDERAQAFEVLRPVLADMEEWAKLLELYEVIVEHEGDDFQRIGLYTTMGEIAEQRMNEPERAFYFHGEAFRLDVERPDSVVELERLAAEHELWERLVELYLAGSEDAMNPEVQLSLRLKVGTFLKDKLADIDRAVKHYNELLEDYSDNQEVLEALDELYYLREDWETLAEILGREIEIENDTAKKIALQFRLGEIAEQQLENPRTAFECYSEVLLLERDNADAVQHLERLFQMPELRLDIADQLETIYVDRADWYALHEMLVLKLEVVTDEIDRLELLKRLAGINLDTLDRKPQAVSWLGQAFVLDPEDEGILSQLFDLVRETEQWADLVEIILEAVARVEIDDRQIELWHRAAKVLEDNLYDRDRAEQMYLNVLELDDENLDALKALDSIYTELEKWTELEEVLRREIDVQPYDDDKVELLTRLAELYRDRLDRWDDAVGAYRQVLEIFDNHRESLLALAEIYEARDEHEPLFKVSESLADVSENDAERVGYLSRMARLAEDKLGSQEEAVRLWEEVLTVQPDDLTAVRELQRLMQATEDWNGYIETCERELRMLADDPTRRLDLYKQVGITWRDRLDDPFQAQEAWQKVLEEAPEDKEALESLRELYRENETYEPLVDVLRRIVDVCGYTGDDLKAVWKELGDLKTNLLPEPQEAIQAWQHVLELDEDDTEAIEALENLYESEAMWEPCVDIIQRKVAHLEDEEEKIEALTRVARIQQDNLSDASAAAQTYEQVLTLQPANFDASAALEKIYEAQEAWEQLAQLLERKTEHLEDPLDKVYTLQTLARLQEEKLQSIEGAFEALYRALQVEPSEIQTLMELERVATQAELWEELTLIYEEFVPQIDDEQQQVEYRTKWAVLLRDKLGRAGDAIARFREVLEADPEHEQTLRALEALYEQEERWDDMIESLAKLVEVTYDGHEQIQFQRKIGETYERRLEDPDSAIDAYRAVLELEEADAEALAALERLFEANERWEDLIEILKAQATLTPDRDTELRLRIGELYEVRLDDADEAINNYEEILNFDPSNSDALARLEALYFEREDWGKLTDTYERLLDVSETDEDRVRFCTNLAQIYEQAFEDGDRAAEAYGRILELQPGNEDALAAMERLYERQESWEELIEVHLRWLDMLEDGSQKAARLVAAAAVYAEKLEDLDNAISTYERVFEFDQENAPAMDALEGLYRRTEQWEQVVTVLQAKANLAEAASEVARLEAARGDVLRDQIHDMANAVSAYERAFEVERGGESIELGLKLVDAYREVERWDDVIQTLRTVQARTEDAGVKADAYCDMAEAYYRHLDDRDGAVDAYERTLELVPHHDRALQALATLYIEEEAWVRALPRLEMQLRRLDADADPERALALYRQTALAAENVLDEDRALQFYAAAYDLDPQHVPTLNGLARLNLKLQKLPEARRYYQEILDAAEDQLENDAIVEIYTAMGDISMRLEDTEAAGEFLEKVLLYQPQNQKAIQDLIKLFEAREDWYEVIRYKNELRNALADDLERLNIQIDIGDTYKDELEDVDGAVSAYREALAIAPESRAANIKLLEIFIESKRYDEAVEILDQLVASTDSKEQKASYCFTAAVIFRDQVKDDERAVEYLDRTLDLDPTRQEAFAYIDEIMTRKREWKSQARYYRKMIQRIRGKGMDDLEFKLYLNLGEIYRSRMRNFEYAISAFALAAQLKPDSIKAHEILAELYSFQGDYDKAVAEHLALLNHQPDRIGSYRAIKQLSLDTRKLDRAWLGAGVLALLNQATEEEQKFYRQHRPKSVKEARGGVDAAMWRTNLFTEPTDFVIGQVFQALYQGIGGMLEAKSLKDLGLKRRDELKKGDLMFLNVLRNVSRVLGVAPPRVFLSQRAVGVRIEGTMPPILLVGPDMLQGKTEAEMGFLLGKLLTYFHPMHILAGSYPVALLRTLLNCAHKYCFPEQAVPEDGPQVEEIVRQMHRLISQQLRVQVVRSMEQFRKAYGSVGDFDVAAWLGRVELTANHAGLLSCGDVETAGRLIRSESVAFSGLTARQKIKDLVLYGIDERFTDLRDRLGLKLS